MKKVVMLAKMCKKMTYEQKLKKVKELIMQMSGGDRGKSGGKGSKREHT